ncbi:CD47 protein, partial [Centropus bengalensis]|nr:CD47 protein [Centropus bengalensis]
GSAQLILTATRLVEATSCNRTVTIPCYVVDLKLPNTRGMFVMWEKQGKLIFSFDGASHEFFRDPSVPTANLASPEDLPKGVASLTFKNEEGVNGNYSCKVTVSNREGKITVELRNITGPWFVLMERAFIIALLLLVIVLCLAQLTFIGNVALFQSRISVLLISMQMFADGFTTESQVGFGLIVVPAVILVLLQYFMFGIGDLPQATYILIGLQIIGYVIAVVGFALSVS